MRRHNHFFFILLLLFCSCGGAPTTIENTPKKKKEKSDVTEDFKDGLLVGTEIIKGAKTPYDEAYGRRGDTIFISSYKGKIEMGDTLLKQRVFLFDIHSEFMLDKMYIIPLSDKTWFVSWQETDHEGVKSYAAVYKTGEPKPEWKLFFDVPNPGIPVLDGKDVYVTYLGIAAKVSVADGKYRWLHDSLFNTAREPFKEFEKPRVFNDRVEFVDYPNPGHRERRDTLRVNPVTGEIIR